MRLHLAGHSGRGPPGRYLVFIGVPPRAVTKCWWPKAHPQSPTGLYHRYATGRSHHLAQTWASLPSKLWGPRECGHERTTGTFKMTISLIKIGAIGLGDHL
jgi:hypothetical protein